MAPNATNRFALLTEGDENSPPIVSQGLNIARDAFLNQVADDTVPWQQVKNRGPLTAQPPPPPKVKTLVIRDQNRSLPVRISPTEMRSCAVSNTIVATGTIGTNTGNDKCYDPHENWCGACNQKFSNKAALQSHIKQSTNHQYYCNLCVRVFKDRNGLKNHVDNSLGHEVFCNLCLSAFKDQWGLKNHFENNYHVGHEFACLTCLLGFRSNTDLVKHLQTAQKHTWCVTCHRPFRTQDERDAHWKKTMVHKHCLEPGCVFDGPDAAALEEHHRLDHFQCGGCKRIFPSQTKLHQHYQECTFSVACPQCGVHCTGQYKLALHLEHCFMCTSCRFVTHHEGNLKIHMIKHATARIPCWACELPMRTYSSLINHLESGACPKFNDPALLMMCLGKWWYSPLYMDLDIHAQIRTGRTDLNEVQTWMNDGLLHPFICRAEGCAKMFGHLSSLVLHMESQACSWGIERLNAPGLEAEFRRVCLRRDSVTA